MMNFETREDGFNDGVDWAIIHAPELSEEEKKKEREKEEKFNESWMVNGVDVRKRVFYNAYRNKEFLGRLLAEEIEEDMELRIDLRLNREITVYRLFVPALKNLDRAVEGELKDRLRVMKKFRPDNPRIADLEKWIVEQEEMQKKLEEDMKRFRRQH